MARLMMDLQVNATGDAVLSSGDFSIAESTPGHQESLLLNNKGDFKENPTIGVGVWGYIDDDGGAAGSAFGNLTRAIAQEFVKDGMEVVSLSVLPSGVIKSDAYYV